MLRKAVSLSVLIFGLASLPADAGRLYWPTHVGDFPGQSVGFILSVNQDGSDFEELVVLSGVAIQSVAVDSTGNRFYWRQKDLSEFPDTIDTIVRKDSDGCATFQIDPESNGGGILALDVPHGKIYWTESDGAGSNGRIVRADLDLSGFEVIVDGLAAPFKIAVDSAGGKFYWNDGFEDTILRADLDGSDVEVLIIVEGNFAGLSLDPVGGKIYWTEMSPAVFRRADLDGSNVEDLSNLQAQDIAVDAAAGKVYWPEGSGYDPPVVIKRADFDGSNEETVLGGGYVGNGLLILDPADDVVIPADCVPALGTGAGALLALLLLALGTRMAKRTRRRPTS